MADKTDSKLGGVLKTIGRGIQKAAQGVGKIIYDHPTATTFAVLGLAALGVGIGLEVVKEGTDAASALIVNGAISTTIYAPMAGTFSDPAIQEWREDRDR